MNKLLLTLTLITFWVSSLFANLGDSSTQNQFRWQTNPVKMVMLDEGPLLTHLNVYWENGAYYIIEISADTVILETVICNQNSVEPPESVMMRCKGLYTEGNGWEKLEDGTPVQGRTREAWRSIGEHLYAIVYSKWDAAPGVGRIDCFVQIGKPQILAGLNKIKELKDAKEFHLP